MSDDRKKEAIEALMEEVSDMDFPTLIKSVPDIYEFIHDIDSVEMKQVKASFLDRADKIGDKKLINSIMVSCEKKIKKEAKISEIRYNRETQAAYLDLDDRGVAKETIENFFQITPIPCT